MEGPAMGQITQDGYTFNSDWIDHRIARLTDGNIPRDVRRYKLLRELEAHKSAMKCMSEMMPDDHAAMAHAKAYLAALEKAFDRRVYEMPHPQPLKRPTVHPGTSRGVPEQV
jgi:hypothetical protein